MLISKQRNHQKVPAIFLHCVLLFGILMNCDSNTGNNPISNNNHIIQGKYESSNNEGYSLFTFKDPDSIFSIYTNATESICTTMVYYGTYLSQNDILQIFFAKYNYRDSCSQQWIDRPDLAGISFPVRNINNNGFEIQIDNFWFHYLRISE